MENLDLTLSIVIQQLADFFGTTTAAISEKLPSFLVSYARYAFFDNLLGNIVIGGFVGLLLGGIYLFIIFVGFEKNNATTKDIVIPIVAVVLAICIFVFTDMVKMIACPEFYAFENLMTFVKKSLR